MNEMLIDVDASEYGTADQVDQLLAGLRVEGVDIAIADLDGNAEFGHAVRLAAGTSEWAVPALAYVRDMCGLSIL